MITLTQDQTKAKEKFFEFLSSDDNMLVIKGYAGVGKTTLVKHLLEELKTLYAFAELLDGGIPQIALTATTHKAARNLEEAILHEGYEVPTIHSFLGLKPYFDTQTKKTSLIDFRPATRLPAGSLLFIDEASFISRQLFTRIKAQYPDCKIIFIGDPLQLPPVQEKTSLVFTSDLPTIELKEVVRQSNESPILKVVTAIRDFMLGSEQHPKVTPDGESILHVNRDDFKQMILKDMDNDWDYTKSKVLTWRNVTAVDYGNYILNAEEDAPMPIQAGSLFLCNELVRNVKTNELVRVWSTQPAQFLGYQGRNVWLSGKGPEPFFVFNRIQDRKEAEKTLTGDEVRYLKAKTIDLRTIYSCTINKCQGDTYDRVYVDLDDVGKCRQPKLLMQLLYVALSRAKNQVILTGDIA